jgi:hypothetical protein
LGFVGFVRKIAHNVSAVSGGDGTFAVQSFKFFSSRTSPSVRAADVTGAAPAAQAAAHPASGGPGPRE